MFNRLISDEEDISIDDIEIKWNHFSSNYQEDERVLLGSYVLNSYYLAKIMKLIFTINQQI